MLNEILGIGYEESELIEKLAKDVKYLNIEIDGVGITESIKVHGITNGIINHLMSLIFDEFGYDFNDYIEKNYQDMSVVFDYWINGTNSNYIIYIDGIEYWLYDDVENWIYSDDKNAIFEKIIRKVKENI